MSQKIKQGNIFGRIGSGIGQGIAEQAPKEIERLRLSSALKKLGDQKDLSPFQRFTGLVAAAHEYPQVVQSGERILNREAQGNALNQFNSDQNKPKPNPFPDQKSNGSTKTTKTPPTLTDEESFSKAQEGAIPRSEDEKFAAAGKRYNSNPAQFPDGPQQAIDYENRVDATNAAIAEANQTKHENLTRIQDKVVDRLKDQYTKLNAKVPADLYSNIEDEAIQATKPKKDGGGGLTEDAAKKIYGKKLDDASRLFKKIDDVASWGGWGITLRPAKESMRALKQIQHEAEELGQTDNLAQYMTSKGKFSPTFSFAFAEPVSRVPNLNAELKKLPEANKQETLAETVYDIPATIKVAPNLAKFVKDNEKASPLAIAYELQKKGYDAQTWLQYLTDHAKELNLRQRQTEQASTPINSVERWNDWWLSSFTGIE